ncbi:MAG: hypothetical protein KBD37_08615, partial [Burkholderiales bacterium]|nr:hypothetical protein [Burkholderiales bacterium]
MKHKSNLIILAALIGSSIVTAYAGEMSKTVAASNHVKFCADLGQVDVTDKIKVKSSSHVKDFAVCQVAKTNSNSSLNTQSSTGNELSVVAPSGEFMQMTDIFDGSKIYQALGEYSYSGDKVSPGTYATIEMSIGKNYCSQEMYMPIDPEVISY